MKIYNEVILSWNDETQQFETVYEDSYNYSGDIIQAANKNTLSNLISTENSLEERRQIWEDLINTSSPTFITIDGFEIGYEPFVPESGNQSYYNHTLYQSNSGTAFYNWCLFDFGNPEYAVGYDKVHQHSGICTPVTGVFPASSYTILGNFYMEGEDSPVTGDDLVCASKFAPEYLLDSQIQNKSWGTCRGNHWRNDFIMRFLDCSGIKDCFILIYIV